MMYRVFLPRGYPEHTQRRYPVVYFHDGRDVFESRGGPDFAIDADGELLTRLMRFAEIREVIAVAVDVFVDAVNTRTRDYTPPGDILFGVRGQADNYARFIIEDLKPLIDSTYRTRPDRENTATVGFSLGGLVSLYLGWDR